MALEFLYTNPVLQQYFLMPKGILAASTILLLILLYLIRPKPKTRVVPSLMFLIRQKSLLTQSSFLRALLRELLLIIQLIALLLFTAAIMQPFVTVDQGALARHSIIVLDASASMQTSMGIQTRWDKALQIAENSLGDTNTIILAGRSPDILVQKAGASEARAALKNAKPKETITNLYDAVTLAGDQGSEGKVVIISDFIDTDTGTDITATANALMAKGLAVHIEPVFEEAQNVGIIGVSIDEKTTAVTVKNYNNEPRAITVSVAGASQSAELAAKASTTVSFPTQPEITKITLAVDGRDDLSVDNEAWTSAPEARKLTVLLITNREDKYLSTLLRLLPNVQLDVTKPPQVPRIDHDLIIFRNIDSKVILPGTFKDALTAADERGAAVIVSAQPNTASIDYRGIQFMGLAGMENGSAVRATQENHITKDVEFGNVQEYFRTETPEESLVLAAATDGTPIITLKPHGSGMLVFYGIIDDTAGFKTTPYYPIFWKRLIDYVTKTPEIATLNYDTGRALSLGGTQTVKTPKTTVRDQRIVLDYQGQYTLDDRTIVANLNSARESDVNGDLVPQKARTGETGKTTSQEPRNLIATAVAALLIILAFELVYLKARGDL